MRNAFVRALTSLAEADARVMLLTGDVGYKIFDDFSARFPGRFLNAGVAEANMIGVAAGLALGGLRPFTYSIAPFVTLRCFEQVRNDLCYHNVPVAIVGVGGGFSYGPNGPTHHSLEDIAIMRSLPNMTVVCPGDPVETELAVLAIGSHQGPLYLRLGRAGDPVVHIGRPPFRIGRAVTVRDGTDCTLIATGGMLPVAVEVADRLQPERVSCRVLSMHTVKPLDGDALEESCWKTRMLFTLEEHSRIGGLGAAVAEWLASSGLRRPLRCFGTEDRFSRYCGSQTYLRQCHKLDAVQVAGAIARWLKKEETPCSPTR